MYIFSKLVVKTFKAHRCIKESFLHLDDVFAYLDDLLHCMQLWVNELIQLSLIDKNCRHRQKRNIYKKNLIHERLISHVNRMSMSPL